MSPNNTYSVVSKIRVPGSMRRTALGSTSNSLFAVLLNRKMSSPCCHSLTPAIGFNGLSARFNCVNVVIVYLRRERTHLENTFENTFENTSVGT